MPFDDDRDTELQVIDVEPIEVEGEVVQESPRPSGGVDFESDKPLIEQVLEGERLDRSDKTQNRGCFSQAVLALCLVLACLAAFLYWLF